MDTDRHNLSDIYAHIENAFADHLERIRSFIRQPSISADGTGIQEMAELVAAQIQGLGGHSSIFETPGHPVVFGDLPAGAQHTVLIYGMYDVQPVVGEEWLVPPFEGEVLEFGDLGRCMVSRGVMNSKGPLVACFNALDSLQQSAGRLPVNVKFVVEGEEEMGSRHLPQFVRKHREALSADMAFFPFFSQDRTGKVIHRLGVKGLVFLELICRGAAWGGPTRRGVHGSHAGWFHSPTWRLVQALCSMLSRDQKQILIDDLMDAVALPTKEDFELLEALKETYDERTQLLEHEVERFKYDLKGGELLRKFLFEPSLNINGIVSGHHELGTKTVLPHTASAKIDVRLVPNMETDRVIGQIREHLDRRGFPEIEVQVHSAYPWSKGRLSDPANAAMIRAYRSLGLEPEVWPIISGSAPFYLFTEELGIPITMGGLGHGGRQHSANEYATVQGILDFEKSVAAFLMESAVK